MAIAIGLFSER